MEFIMLIVAAIVWMAERLALALMLYMLLSLVISVFEQPIRRLHARIMRFVSGLRWTREAVQFWTALRLVRRQVMP